MSEEFFEALNKPKADLSDAQREMEGKYRHVFTRDAISLEVLSDILVSFCHFGCYVDDGYQMAQHNVGVNILSRIGIFRPENRKNVLMAMVNAIPQKVKEE